MARPPATGAIASGNVAHGREEHWLHQHREKSDWPGGMLPPVADDRARAPRAHERWFLYSSAFVCGRAFDLGNCAAPLGRFERRRGIATLPVPIHAKPDADPLPRLRARNRSASLPTLIPGTGGA